MAFIKAILLASAAVSFLLVAAVQPASAQRLSVAHQHAGMYNRAHQQHHVRRTYYRAREHEAQPRLHHVRGGAYLVSDIRLKHDIVLLGHLDDGLGFYRFSYNGSDKAYVGVMAQEVEAVMPQAVMRGRDGYLKVSYEKLGLNFQTYRHWIAAGARIPSGASR